MFEYYYPHYALMNHDKINHYSTFIAEGIFWTMTLLVLKGFGKNNYF
jgi:hypothetical protein